MIVLVKLFEDKSKSLGGNHVLDCQEYKKVVPSLEDNFNLFLLVGRKYSFFR